MVTEENLSIYMLTTETDVKIWNLTSTRQHFPGMLMDLESEYFVYWRTLAVGQK